MISVKQRTLQTESVYMKITIFTVHCLIVVITGKKMCLLKLFKIDTKSLLVVLHIYLPFVVCLYIRGKNRFILNLETSD